MKKKTALKTFSSKTFESKLSTAVVTQLCNTNMKVTKFTIKSRGGHSERF